MQAFGDFDQVLLILCIDITVTYEISNLRHGAVELELAVLQSCFDLVCRHNLKFLNLSITRCELDVFWYFHLIEILHLLLASWTSVVKEIHLGGTGAARFDVGVGELLWQTCFLCRFPSNAVNGLFARPKTSSYGVV